MSYSITLADIGNYLDSKQDDDVIGIAAHCEQCLVANAIRFKYPEIVFVSIGGSQATIGFADDSAWQSIRFSSNLYHLYREFDTVKTPDNAITKREWLALEAEVAG